MRDKNKIQTCQTRCRVGPFRRCAKKTKNGTRAEKIGGDVKARMVFSSEEYSANESETVENSPTLSAKHRFTYKGDSIDMFRHLKIGKVDNVAHTLRVHFAWIPTEKKIVIGHCGEHLPISSH